MGSPPLSRRLILAIWPVMACSLIYYGSVFAASIDQAIKQLDAGEKEVAFEQFTELAKTGDKRAQYALGLMYADGAGTDQDLTLAYGWLKVAAETDQEQVIAARDTVFKSLNPEQRPEAEKQADQLIDQYGRAAIRAQGKIICERYSTIGSHMVKKRCYRRERERQRELERGSFSTLGQALGAPPGIPGIGGSN